ncbi:MAG TPA: hypothetical protein VF678_06980 [bacterium]
MSAPLDLRAGCGGMKARELLPNPHTEAQWRAVWDSINPAQKDRIKAKAKWEGETLSYVIHNWGIPKENGEY